MSGEENGATVRERLAALGFDVPEAAAPVANYRPWKRVGGLVFVSGQLPVSDGRLRHVGRLGADCDIETARAAARLCALNCIGQAAAALDGDLERVETVVKITGYVAATSDFADHPRVVDAASELMIQAFAERGRHARAAVGCASLPLGVPVEVEAIFAVRD